MSEINWLFKSNTEKCKFLLIYMKLKENISYTITKMLSIEILQEGGCFFQIGL